MHALLLVCALSVYTPQDSPRGWVWHLDDLSINEARFNYHLSLEFQAKSPSVIVLDERWEVVVAAQGGEGEEAAGAIKGVRGPLVDAARAAGQSKSWAKGSVVASDAFFPFADGLLASAEAGATAVIQPGGSIRDEEVIEAADDAGLAMVFTAMRHFRH